MFFSGPTGSGKSTSLDALLSEMMKQMGSKIHLLTIEDPPEYHIDGAVQTPLICDRDDPEAVGREWTRSISSSMRLDPDVMMIGEMRDKDSAATAFSCSDDRSWCLDHAACQYRFTGVGSTGRYWRCSHVRN
ncbi:ATPase, T2SS/T4P/T4SS family [Undibacterium arcticum]